MVSSFVLLEGIITIGNYALGVSMGLYALYKATKTEAKILKYFGITILFLSQIYLVTILDFLTIIITGNNMDNSFGLFSLLTYIWIGPSIILGMYIIFEVTIPEKKWYILPIYVVLSVVFEILLFLDPLNSFKISYTTPDGGIIHSSLVFGTVLFVILSFIFVSAFILFGVGFFIIGIQTTGILREKFIILSYAFIAFLSLGAVDILTTPGIYVIFLRIGELSCAVVFYFGIKEESVEVSETKIIKSEFEGPKISLVTSLETYSKPDELSEEAIQYMREQTLCIICKAKLQGFVSIYICPQCKTFYCEKCAKELVQIDNMCWGCMKAIDDTKPIKPIEEIDKDIIVDSSQKPPKKLKKKNNIAEKHE
ncbi:MAG: DC1 domain-containing protein [Promethearchaeota archaeon]